MKKVVIIILSAFTISFFGYSSSTWQAIKGGISDVQREHNARYGEGHFNDLTKSAGNMDKMQLLSPYQSRINRLYDD